MTKKKSETMKRYNRKTRSRKGMAMLVVLFIVMAIAIISSGFIARSDVALACGRNFCVRNEADYAAWGGLEVAWALVQDPNGVFPYNSGEQSADWGAESNNLKYELTIDSPVATDPNVVIHSVTCRAYKTVNEQQQAVSRVSGELQHDGDSGTARYIAIRRE